MYIELKIHMWPLDEGLMCPSRRRLSLFEGLTISPRHFKEYRVVFLTEMTRASPRDAGNLLEAATHNWIHNCNAKKSLLTRGLAKILFCKKWYPRKYLGQELHKKWVLRKTVLVAREQEHVKPFDRQNSLDTLHTFSDGCSGIWERRSKEMSYWVIIHKAILTVWN